MPRVNRNRNNIVVRIIGDVSVTHLPANQMEPYRHTSNSQTEQIPNEDGTEFPVDHEILEAMEVIEHAEERCASDEIEENSSIHSQGEPIYHENHEPEVNEEQLQMPLVDYLNFQPLNSIEDKKQLFIVQDFGDRKRVSQVKYAIVYIQKTIFSNGERLLTSCSFCPACSNYDLIRGSGGSATDPGISAAFFTGCIHLRTVLLQLYLSTLQERAVSMYLVDIEAHFMQLMRRENSIENGLLY
jgi:hypothetical protein